MSSNILTVTDLNSSHAKPSYSTAGECVRGKQTPGWRLSALTALPVKFRSWLPTLAIPPLKGGRK